MIVYAFVGGGVGWGRLLLLLIFSIRCPIIICWVAHSILSPPTTCVQSIPAGGAGMGAAAGGASAVVEEEGDVDETGVEAKDIELVMSQARA